MKEFLQQYPIPYSIARFVHSIPRKTKTFTKQQLGAYRLKKAVKKSPLRIVIGSSGLFDKNWTPTDIEYLNLTISEDWQKHFKENTIDAILSEHVWEHLNLENGLTAAKNCYKYLKPGGYLRIAVPDGLHPSESYIKSVDIGGTGEGAYDHQVLYSYQILKTLLEKAGFRVQLLEYFDEDGQFHYFDWSVDQGKIHRSSKFDERNSDGNLNYTSLIVDAYK